MTTGYPEPHSSRHFQGLILPANPTSGTEDGYDDRDDEHAGENEASVTVIHDFHSLEVSNRSAGGERSNAQSV